MNDKIYVDVTVSAYQLVCNTCQQKAELRYFPSDIEVICPNCQATIFLAFPVHTFEKEVIKEDTTIKNKSEDIPKGFELISDAPKKKRIVPFNTTIILKGDGSMWKRIKDSTPEDISIDESTENKSIETTSAKDKIIESKSTESKPAELTKEDKFKKPKDAIEKTNRQLQNWMGRGGIDG